MFSLALLLFVALVQAQTIVRSVNLTLTFSADSANNCVTRSNVSGSAITFSTFHLPGYGACFNLNETFTANQSSGLQRGQWGASIGGVPLELSWYTGNGAAFDPKANYSQVWYQQVNFTGEIGAGQTASRYLKFYPGYDCFQTSDYIERPTYQYNCQSDASGVCHTAPYSIASFAVYSSRRTAGSNRKCWEWNPEGSAANVVPASLWGMVAALALVVVGVPIL